MPIAPESTEFRWSHDGIDFVGRLHEAPEAWTTVWLIHGLGEHSGRYRGLIEWFTSNGCHVATFDQRGHGVTTGKRGDAPGLDALHDDIVRFGDEVRRRLGDDTRPFLYGHSFGGLLVLDHLRRHDSEYRGAVASAPALRPGVTPPRWKVALGRMLLPIAPRFAMSSGVDPEGLARRADVSSTYAADPLVHRRISVRLGLEVLARGEALLADPYATRTPVLVMHGDADTVTDFSSSETLSDRSENVKFRRWADLRHELHHEPERADVFRFVLAWMRGHSTPSP